jgi:hypothetical protein
MKFCFDLESGRILWRLGEQPASVVRSFRARLQWLPLNFRLQAIGVTVFIAALSCRSVRAEMQSGPSMLSPSQSHAAQLYAVGDQVPSSVKIDDDGFPNRRYEILIVDGAIVVVIDRATRRVVEVLQ